MQWYKGRYEREGGTGRMMRRHITDMKKKRKEQKCGVIEKSLGATEVSLGDMERLGNTEKLLKLKVFFFFTNMWAEESKSGNK